MIYKFIYGIRFIAEEAGNRLHGTRSTNYFWQCQAMHAYLVTPLPLPISLDVTAHFELLSIAVAPKIDTQYNPLPVFTHNAVRKHRKPSLNVGPARGIRKCLATLATRATAQLSPVLSILSPVECYVRTRQMREPSIAAPACLVPRSQPSPCWMPRTPALGLTSQ